MTDEALMEQSAKFHTMTEGTQEDWDIIMSHNAPFARSGGEFRGGAMTAFLDEKKFKPGLATYNKDGSKKKSSGSKTPAKAAKPVKKTSKK